MSDKCRTGLFILLSGCLLILSACEAPLTLGRVEAERQKPVHRYDEFMAATTNKDNITVVVGSEGTVLSSTDAGQSWQRRQLVGKPALIDITSCPDGGMVALDFGRRVWVASGNMTNWQAQDLPDSETPQAITCDPQGRLWVVTTFSGIYSSLDGGKTWASAGLDEDVILTTIQFVDRDSGFITGEFGTVLVTTDAGASWQSGEAVPGDFYPQAAYFKDSNQGWLVGLNGVIYHTADGAKSWIRQKNESNAPLFGIAAHGLALYAVGDGGLVLSLVEDRWQKQSFEHKFSSFLRIVHAIDSEHLLLAGGRGNLSVVLDGSGAG